MTAPTGAPKPKPSPMFVVALRHERDCWNVLVVHTLRCTPCSAMKLVCGQHGLGCGLGKSMRGEWLGAARRRYELSPDFTTCEYKPAADAMQDKKLQEKST